MHKRTFICGICVLAIVFVAAATDLWAQDGQGYAPDYSAADQAPAPVSSQPQMVAAGQPRPPKMRPPTTALCRRPKTTRTRIWRNEFQTWRSSWRTTPKRPRRPSPQAPTKPLIAPSGRIQFDVANFTQNAASDASSAMPKTPWASAAQGSHSWASTRQIDYIIEMDFANRGINSAINSERPVHGLQGRVHPNAGPARDRQCPRRSLQGVLWTGTTHQRQLHHVHGAVGRRRRRVRSRPQRRHHGVQLDREPAGHLGDRRVHESDRIRPAADVQYTTIGGSIWRCGPRICRGTTRPAAAAACSTPASTTPTAAPRTTSAPSPLGPSRTSPRRSSI